MNIKYEVILDLDNAKDKLYFKILSILAKDNKVTPSEMATRVVRDYLQQYAEYCAKLIKSEDAKKN